MYKTVELRDFLYSFTLIELAEWEHRRRQLEAEKLCREDDARRQEINRLRQERSERQREAESSRMEAERQERKELIQWLKPFDYNSKHQSSTQLRQEGTCGWILENDAFQDWRSGSGSNFLWLCGIRTSSVWLYCFRSHSCM